MITISEDKRKDIFTNCWALGDLARQRDFIASCMQNINPVYRYTRNKNKRSLNKAFYFKLLDQPVRVCKIFFKATLGINDRPIRTIAQKKKSGIVLSDLRGKHRNHFTVDEAMKTSVRQHIQSIQRIESHYL